MKSCDLVTERIALGEPLGDLDAHIATCPECAKLTALPGLVAASARAAEPGPGFSSRATVGARHRLAVRRRNRLAATALAAASVLAVGGVAMTHRSEQPQPGAMRMVEDPTPLDTSSPEPTVADQDLAVALARISDVDGAIGPIADWHRIETPLSPYQALLVAIRQGASR